MLANLQPPSKRFASKKSSKKRGMKKVVTEDSLAAIDRTESLVSSESSQFPFGSFNSENNSNKKEPSSLSQATAYPTKNDQMVDLDSKSVAFINNYENVFTRNYNRTSNLFVFPPRSRVITLFHLLIKNRKTNHYEEEYMCSGTVIEVAKPDNLNRYLVLFDNGCVQYVKPSIMFPIFDFFDWPIDGRLHADHLKYLNYYFERYDQN